MPLPAGGPAVRQSVMFDTDLLSEDEITLVSLGAKGFIV
jgi:hypothetical protein